ncbi:MAG: GntR family transcriptional regulator [Gemmatimonadota bacterium]
MSKSAQPVSRLIAQALERRIIDGRYAASLPLRQAELAEEFGASHIPVREALASLAQKGLVEILPNRGAVVVPLSVSQCAELAEMRVALELVALRHSVPRLGAAQIDAARRALERGRSARSLASRARQNWNFHRALCAACDRPFLLGQIETLWRHADRYLQYAWSRAHYEERSDREHAQILQACIARDVRSACGLTRLHILAAAASVAALLRNRESS